MLLRPRGGAGGVGVKRKEDHGLRAGTSPLNLGKTKEKKECEEKKNIGFNRKHLYY